MEAESRSRVQTSAARAVPNDKQSPSATRSTPPRQLQRQHLSASNTRTPRRSFHSDHHPGSPQHRTSYSTRKYESNTGHPGTTNVTPDRHPGNHDQRHGEVFATPDGRRERYYNSAPVRRDEHPKDQRPSMTSHKSVNGIENVPTGPKRPSRRETIAEAKRMPHLFISCLDLPAESHFTRHLCGLLKGYLPDDILIDGFGWYLVFEDSPAGRLRLHQCFQQFDNRTLFDQYRLRFHPYSHGQIDEHGSRSSRFAAGSHNAAPLEFPRTRTNRAQSPQSAESDTQSAIRRELKDLLNIGVGSPPANHHNGSPLKPSSNVQVQSQSIAAPEAKQASRQRFDGRHTTCEAGLGHKDSGSLSHSPLLSHRNQEPRSLPHRRRASSSNFSDAVLSEADELVRKSFETSANSGQDTQKPRTQEMIRRRTTEKDNTSLDNGPLAEKHASKGSDNAAGPLNYKAVAPSIIDPIDTESLERSGHSSRATSESVTPLAIVRPYLYGSEQKKEHVTTPTAQPDNRAANMTAVKRNALFSTASASKHRGEPVKDISVGGGAALGDPTEHLKGMQTIIADVRLTNVEKRTARVPVVPGAKSAATMSPDVQSSPTKKITTTAPKSSRLSPRRTSQRILSVPGKCRPDFKTTLCSQCEDTVTWDNGSGIGALCSTCLHKESDLNRVTGSKGVDAQLSDGNDDDDKDASATTAGSRQRAMSIDQRTNVPMKKARAKFMTKEPPLFGPPNHGVRSKPEDAATITQSQQISAPARQRTKKLSAVEKEALVDELGDIHKRPKGALAKLIGMALRGINRKALASEIRDWIARNIPQYEIGEGNWEGSLQACLSGKQDTGSSTAMWRKTLPDGSQPMKQGNRAYWEMLPAQEATLYTWDPVGRRPIPPHEQNAAINAASISRKTLVRQAPDDSSSDDVLLRKKQRKVSSIKDHTAVSQDRKPPKTDDKAPTKEVVLNAGDDYGEEAMDPIPDCDDEDDEDFYCEDSSSDSD